MRLRNVRHASETLDAHPQWAIREDQAPRGAWRQHFGSSAPLHLEIGCGKGQFITGMAALHPEIHFIGMEKFDAVSVRALKRVVASERPNVRLFRADAEKVLDLFDTGEVDRIYLNFSDPWPKKAHIKRRLTAEPYLDRYRQILKPGGELHLKTDNRGFFEFSLLTMNAVGLRFQELSLDLHAQEPAGNIRTEYEEAWSAKGARIYRLVATYPC